MLSVRAPAKLNLNLHITGKRADGYHLLESTVVFAALADELAVAPAPELSLSVTGEFAHEAGGGEGNLVLKAARLLQQVSGTKHGAALTLQKNIPVGAGLGGGSSDAAAALRLLNDFWQLGLADDALFALAPQLGADVAMCLSAAPAVARGVGEILSPLACALPPLQVVLVYPRAPLLTAQVYAYYTADGTMPPMRPEWHDAAGFFAWLRGTRNDLQRPAIAALPLVAEMLLAMETTPPLPELVRMTGSGACCFALFTDADRAARFAGALRAHYPGWWVQASAILA